MIRMGDIGDFKNQAFVLPDPDNDILTLMKDFKAYVDTLITEEDNAADVYKNWISRKSDILSGLTPFEYIIEYAEGGKSFEKYEKIVLCMLSHGIFSLPDEVLDDFFSRCEDPAAWREKILKYCLANIGSPDSDISVRCFMLLRRLSDTPGCFKEAFYPDFISAAAAMMDENEDYASEILMIAVAYCENGFERTVEMLSEKVAAKAPLGPIETKLLAVLCIEDKKDDRLYAILRTLVKTADMFDEELKFYFTLVKDYGDLRAVSFMRTKVGQMREAYLNSDANDEKAKRLFDNAYHGDCVIRSLGGAGLF